MISMRFALLHILLSQISIYMFKAMLLHMITDKFEPLNKIDVASKLLNIWWCVINFVWQLVMVSDISYFQQYIWTYHNRL